MTSFVEGLPPGVPPQAPPGPAEPGLGVRRFVCRNH